MIQQTFPWGKSLRVDGTSGSVFAQLPQLVSLQCRISQAPTMLQPLLPLNHDSAYRLSAKSSKFLKSGPPSSLCFASDFVTLLFIKGCLFHSAFPLANEHQSACPRKRSPVPEKECPAWGCRVAATWEVKRAGELGFKETLSQASGASHFSWLLCCNDGAHPTTTASQCIRSMTISSCGSAGHERPQGRQLVPKLWVWLGWALHQAFTTIVQTEHWLMRQQLPRGSSF